MCLQNISVLLYIEPLLFDFVYLSCPLPGGLARIKANKQKHTNDDDGRTVAHHIIIIITIMMIKQQEWQNAGRSNQNIM